MIAVLAAARRNSSAFGTWQPEQQPPGALRAVAPDELAEQGRPLPDRIGHGRHGVAPAPLLQHPDGAAIPEVDPPARRAEGEDRVVAPGEVADRDGYAPGPSGGRDR